MSGIQKIPIIMVETCLMNLPYVAEACIVGVADYAKMQLCGAVIRLHQQMTLPITLTQIRSDLAPSLVPYMLPTLLRILREGEELPRNGSGKVMRSQVLQEYFGKGDGVMTSTVPADVEQCSPPTFELEGAKPWYASGLQRA
jgi:malonyl-CoA/methylmalonyl-CoA synthetase